MALKIQPMEIRGNETIPVRGSISAGINKTLWGGWRSQLKCLEIRRQRESREGFIKPTRLPWNLKEGEEFS